MATTFDRRAFLKTTSAAALSVGFGGAHLLARAPRTASDRVTLGKSGITLSRLGIGTGSDNGQVQRNMGQAAFTDMVHAAYERGITYIDTAHNYQTHGMVKEAIKGLPREKFYIQTKMPWDRAPFTENPLVELDRFRTELGVEYIDSVLIHCATKHTWPTDLKFMQDAFSDAQSRGVIRIKGVSCHGLPALTAATTNDWIDVHLARVNAQAHHMDGAAGVFGEPGDRPAAMKELEAMHARGHGIIGMKLVGNGDFKDPADREKAMQFVLGCGCVDAVVVGMSSIAQLDETIGRMNRILAEA